MCGTPSHTSLPVLGIEPRGLHLLGKANALQLSFRAIRSLASIRVWCHVSSRFRESSWERGQSTVMSLAGVRKGNLVLEKTI